MAGIEQIPIRYPREAPAWFTAFMDAFIKDVLALADARNAIPGLGITIDGRPDQPATISSNTDIDQLVDENYLVAESSPLLPNARTLDGEGGVLQVTDSGPGGIVRITVAEHGITYSKFRQGRPCSVVGRPDNSVGEQTSIEATANDTVLRRVDDALSFGSLTVGMAPDGLWTYAKIQNVSATARVLGRKASDEGPIEECTLSDVLDFIGSAADGDMLIRAGGIWTRLPAGTEGQVLMIVSGVPTWVDPPFASAAASFVTAADETDDMPNSRQLVSGDGITLDDSAPGQLEISTL